MIYLFYITLNSNRIRLHDALTLFQEYHGDAFSLHTWHHFLQSRVDPASDVCIDEIREWLCSPPSGEPASDREVREEVLRLQQSHWEHFQEDYKSLKLLQVGVCKVGLLLHVWLIYVELPSPSSPPEIIMIIIKVL